LCKDKLSFKKYHIISSREKIWKPQAFNFLATPRQSAISSFRSFLSFFNSEAQIDGGKKYGGNETWTALYFSRSGFVKRFASLATVFPSMSLRLHVPTTFIDFIGSHSCSVASRIVWITAFSYYSKSQFQFYQFKNISSHHIFMYIKLQKFSSFVTYIFCLVHNSFLIGFYHLLFHINSI